MKTTLSALLNVLIVPSPSPDGRHIAIGASRQTTNLWMIEDF